MPRFFHRREAHATFWWLLAGCAADVEWLGFDCFANDSASQALHADSHRFVGAVGQGDVDLLQVRFELSSRDASDFGTNTTQVLRFTASFDAIAHLDFLAANFALAGHEETSEF